MLKNDYIELTDLNNGRVTVEIQTITAVFEKYFYSEKKGGKKVKECRAVEYNNQLLLVTDEYDDIISKLEYALM